MFNWEDVRLQVILTNRCNYKCSHCYKNDMPRDGDKVEELSPDDLLQVLTDYAKRGGHDVTFTGGEPTLSMNTLLSGILFCTQNNIHTTVITNTWWGAEKLVENYLYLFSTMGLNRLRLSFDSFHAEYASWENVKRIYELSQKYGIVAFICWATRAKDLEKEIRDIVGEDINYALENITVGSAVSIGRGKNVTASWERFPFVCPQTLPVRLKSPLATIMPGKVCWRCEALNPDYTYSYNGDWTKKIDEVELSRVDCMVRGFLLMEDAAGEQAKDFYDGCGLCMKYASIVNH